MKALKHPLLNGWPLFWGVVGPVSAWITVAWMGTDTNTGEGVSSLVGLSVRLAIPWLYLAFAASALQILRPGGFSLWLLRNRKFFGLAFAAAMAWQAFFILWLVTVHRDYYVAEVYVLRDVIEGVIGYAFLLAMTVTSFMPVRKRMRPKHWKWLHKIGIYALWVYAFAVYWWAHAYYPQPTLLDHLYYWAGFLAWGLRVAAWRKKRLQKAGRVDAPVPPVLLAAGALLVLLGLVGAATGVAWQPGAEHLLYGHGVTRWPELYLPYWPFEPFLPLAFIGLGAWLSSLAAPRQAPLPDPG